MSFDPKRGSAAAYAGAIERRKAENRAKTFCPKGHEYDDENTIRRRSGRRRCRVCANQYHARRYDKVRGSGPGQGSHNRAKTHCAQGHPLSGKNLYSTKAGRRKCRECNARWTIESRVRRASVIEVVIAPSLISR